jgi:hypothetical protein
MDATYDNKYQKSLIYTVDAMDNKSCIDGGFFIIIKLVTLFQLNTGTIGGLWENFNKFRVS